MLSRDQMVAVINGGGSVKLPNGKLATKIEHLPSAAALAQTPEEKQKASEDLQAQIEKLQSEKAALEAADEGSNGSDDTLEELMKHSREQLVQKATKLGIEFKSDATKAELSQAILAKGK